MDSEVSMLLGQGTEKLFSRAAEKTPTPEFSHAFTGELWRLIGHQARRIQPETPTTLASREGAFGVSSAAARRINTTELLSGQLPTPLKEYEEEVVLGMPTRQVEKAVIHMFNEINPVCATDVDEIRAVVSTLRSIGHELDNVKGSEKVYIGGDEEGDPGTLVSDMSAVVHFFHKNAFSQYQFVDQEVTGSVQAERLIARYKELLKLTSKVDPNGIPRDDFITYNVLINPHIVKSIQASNSPHTLGVGVLVAPKEVRYNTGKNLHSYTASIFTHTGMQQATNNSFMQVGVRYPPAFGGIQGGWEFQQHGSTK